jgi:chromosome segregation ATPase
VALKKPSDLFANKSEDDNVPVIESDNSFREELNKVENLSEQVIQLQQELSQKVIKNDLESLVLSQINTMQENFDYLQNDFRKSNKKDIVEFKERVSELTEIVGNLVENELPKYKRQVTKNEVRIGDKFDDLKEVVEENIVGIRDEIDTKVNDIVGVIDNNLEYFNNQLQETSTEVKKTSDTYNNLSKILESKILKENKRNDLYINEKIDDLKKDVEENIVNIRTEVDVKVDGIKEVIDTNLESFNNQLQKTSSEVKKTADTYNKLSKIVENKVSKENEKLEEYSQVIQSLYEAFTELEKSLQEETSTCNQIIEEKFETISSDVKNKIDSIDKNIKDKINSIDEEVDTFKNQVSSEVSNIKADVVIFEKHNKDTEKTIQVFSEQLYKISEIDNGIISINGNIDKLQNQYDIVSNQSIETKKDLEVVERYIQNHHRELVDLKEEVFGEIEQIPVGNIQENLERLEKKIDYIKETYSKIEPQVIVKEVIKEGLLNEPPNTKNSDPLTPLDQKFVTQKQLESHYSLFINRIQQQLSTLGGGGETQLKYLDDIVGIQTNASAYDGKYLQWNSATNKAEFVNVSGGGQSYWVSTSAGIHTLSNVGIGTTLPTSALTVVGNVLVTGVTTSTIFNSSSDINLKKDIIEIENPLATIEQLHGVKFTWKSDDKKSIGIIAQEVEKVLPELVSQGNVKSVDYNGIIAVLIEAIKELSTEVLELKNKLNT